MKKSQNIMKKIIENRSDLQGEMKDTGIKKEFARTYQFSFTESSAKVHDLMTNRIEDISYGTTI